MSIFFGKPKNYENLHVSDDQFIRNVYEERFHKTIDLENPRTYTEKLNWCKLYDHNPALSQFADPLTVKDYAAGLIGYEPVIPVLKLYSSPEDIIPDELPEEGFEIRFTHNTDANIVRYPKEKLRKRKLIKDFNMAMGAGNYLLYKEWPYNAILPKAYLQPLILDEFGGIPKSVTFFCFMGEPRAYEYDGIIDLVEQDVQIPLWNIMLELATRISTGFSQLVVEVLSLKNIVYLKDISLFYKHGFEPFSQGEWDSVMGDWFVLPERNA